ncbi:LytR C-terminal domain-containing protein [Candidatus Parcubacteria bacterium]|nr:LytR C-terminal domain-containing protein [Patescibacteria group bacterium]MCG2688997.1 LytR C-terminal domain-containing protein [Candidatus Parcubacteria bacterium]
MPRKTLRPKRTRHTRSWKQAHAVKKFFKKVRLVLFGICCVLFSGAVLYALSVFNLFKAPFVSASDNYAGVTTAWDGRSSLNVLFGKNDGGSYGLLRVVPDLGSYQYLLFPEGEIREIGTKYALAVNRYISCDTNGEKVVKTILGDFEKGEIGEGNYAKFLLSLKENAKFARDGVKTNLSLPEVFLLANFMKTAKKSEVSTVAIDAGGDGAKFDFLWQQTLNERILGEEGAKVLVLNATQEPGLATQMGRILKNSGLYVLDAQNSEQIFDQSVVAYNGNSYPQTLKTISQNLNLKTILWQDDLSVYTSNAYRADIIVVVGVDKIGSL